MHKTTRPFTLLLATMALTASQAWAAAIQVSGVQKYIGGPYTAVPNSGVSSNYAAGGATGGSFAVFDVQKDGRDFADLRVTYNGGAGTNIMVARTSNSQGLTDNGTITILMDYATNSGYKGSFQFDWFTPGSFTGGIQYGSSLISDAILYTTFDIDYYQFVATKTNQLQYYAFNTNTLLHADVTEAPGFIRFEDNNANSLFSEPRTAAQFLTKSGTASHQIDMGKQTTGGASLFMFEFRDPSLVLRDTGFNPVPVAIPEPTTASFVVLFAGIGFLIRRRFVD